MPQLQMKSPSLPGKFSNLNSEEENRSWSPSHLHFGNHIQRSSLEDQWTGNTSSFVGDNHSSPAVHPILAAHRPSSCVANENCVGNSSHPASNFLPTASQRQPGLPFIENFNTNGTTHGFRKSEFRSQSLGFGKKSVGVPQIQAEASVNGDYPEIKGWLSKSGAKLSRWKSHAARISIFTFFLATS